ncbi:hypothetical protein HK405_015083, partial [Cladochytrium tenue]
AILRLNALFGHLNNVAFLSGIDDTADAGDGRGGTPSPEENAAPPQALPASLLAAARAERLRLQTHVRAALPTLLALSRAEVRLEGPLQSAEYSDILRRVGLLLDTLNAAWISLQGKSFGGEILGMLLGSEEARLNRKEMRDKTRPQRDLLFRTFHGNARVYLARRYHAARQTPSFLTVSAEDGGPVAATAAPTSVATTPAGDAAAELTPGATVGDLRVAAKPSTLAPASAVAGAPDSDGDGEVDELAAAGVPAPDSVETFRTVTQSDAWMRLLAYALSMRLFAAELDALAGPVRRLFGDDTVPEDALWALTATADDTDIATIA